MEFLVNNWNIVSILILVIVGLISFYFGDKKVAKIWLLKAVLDAEKEFGSKTGVLKLRTVYDLFISKFPILSRIMSFNQFSKMVDVVLEEMRLRINTNQAVYDYVNNTERKE